MISPIGTSLGPNRRKRSAFTLIELALVAVIISVLIALSSPLLKKRFSDLELRNTVFNISRTISYAQEMAIIDKSSYKLNFEFEKGRYWITRREDADGASLYKRIGGRYGKVFAVPAGLALGGTCQEVVLYPDGRAGDCTINVFGKDRAGCELRIKGFGSQVEITDINDKKQ